MESPSLQVSKTQLDKATADVTEVADSSALSKR